ncbi:hypothetical protein MesoLj113c_43810 [Mesorhizobium sp. 113-3-9]|uniref:Rap1a/Tai family immunity protein n=1 Tax=Mesorhizobium sp. 113-3-9 TaxID=2744517 RepID=UPI0019266BCE|nr:Rap1a/Tai family immunity protein [Mesorhizobium sp. 113-3-9]BCG88271.1 hypothetical protein MesoLj113c_43810 [Mesorhizobium sp. 113-3-9]
MKYTIAVTLILASSGASKATEGTQLLEACRELVAGIHSDNQTEDGIIVPSTFTSGLCMGSMQMLKGLSQLSFQGESRPALALCVPTEVRTTQYARIVVKYLDAHPEELHQDGSYLAYIALNSAFPCKNVGN